MVLNNPGDHDTSENRLYGGYTYTQNDAIEILKTTQVFDRSLVELTISIPELYKSDIVKYLMEQKVRLIELLQNEIIKDKLHNFVFFIKLVILMSKQNPDSSEDLQRIYINSHRYIISTSNLSVIIDKIVQ